MYIQIHTTILSRLDKKRIYISLFFSLVLLTGTALSTVHFHNDDTSGSETVHQLVEDDFQCVICGSVFKYSPQSESVSNVFINPTTVRYFQPTLSYDSSELPSFDGRAPPVSA